MNNTIDEEEFQFQEKREEKYSPMDRIFYHQLARSRFYSTDSEYIYIHSVSNNRVLVCIRGFIIAWLRSIEIPRSACYSKRRQKLSPIRARWSNLAKFQAKFQYRNVPIQAAQRVSNLLEKLARFDPSFSFPFIFEERLNDVRYIYIYIKPFSKRTRTPALFSTFGNCRFSERKTSFLLEENEKFTLFCETNEYVYIFHNFIILYISPIQWTNLKMKKKKREGNRLLISL